MVDILLQVLLFASLLSCAFGVTIAKPLAPERTATSPARPKTTIPTRHPGEKRPTPVIAAIEPGCTTIGTSTSCHVGINKLTATAQDSQYLYTTTGSTTVVATTTILSSAGQTNTGLIVAPVATSLALAIQSAIANGETDDQIKKQFQGDITTQNEATKQLQERFAPAILWAVAEGIVFFATVIEYFRRTEKSKAFLVPVIVVAKPQGPTLSTGTVFTGYCGDDCYSNYDVKACAILAGVGGMCHCSPPCQNQRCKPGEAPWDKFWDVLKAKAKANRLPKSGSEVQPQKILKPDIKPKPT
ncbi:hypothetical protein MMC32_007616 [Xylographa parallela]|nr:hypothetical protein [Xylographa parallela]